MKCYTDNQGRNPKRLFVSLMTGSFVALVAVFATMWWIARPGLLELNSWLPEVFGLCLLVLAGLMALGIFSMVAGIMGWPVPRFLHRQTYGLMNILFYVALGAGRLLHIPRRRIEGSFVAVSNQIIKNRHLKVMPDTGGTLARQTVMKIRPKAVVAIACERDLASGIQDVYPIPSVGVLNLRPNGPCYNTHVDLEEFRRAIEEILILPSKDEKH